MGGSVVYTPWSANLKGRKVCLIHPHRLGESLAVLSLYRDGREFGNLSFVFKLSELVLGLSMGQGQHTFCGASNCAARLKQKLNFVKAFLHFVF